MPTVPSAPSRRSHSWVEAYWRSSGTFMSLGLGESSSGRPHTMEGLLFDHSRETPAANFDFDLFVDPREFGRDIRHADADLQRRRKAAAGRFRDLLVAFENRV